MTMKSFRDVVGVAFIALGLGFALYCGGYLMLVGGIIEIGHAVNGGGIVTMLKGLAKVLLAGTVSILVGMVTMTIGWKIRGVE